MNNNIEKLSDMLRKRRLILVSVESCTGGMFAAAITNLPGSSDIFDRGLITYSNAAKQDLLGVTTETLERYGAVSEECANEMVLGAIKNSEANVALAITGIAGPSGGAPEKPVGLVYIATCMRGYEPNVAEYNFYGDRGQVRALACAKAFDLLVQAIDATCSNTDN